MKTVLLYFTITLFLVSTTLLAQPAIQWQKSLGSTGIDETYSIRQTTDGGYVTMGYAGSTNGDFIGNVPYSSSVAIKFDSIGNVQWMSFPVGSSQYDIRQTPDGGYISAGYSIVKMSALGVVQWQMPTTAIVLNSVCVTNSGNYMVAGIDTAIVGNSWDYYVAKLNTSGTVLWQKSFGGTLADEAYAINATTDGGCIVIGSAGSSDGDVTGAHGGGDCWAIKLDSMGNLQWQRALGGSLAEISNDRCGVAQTTDMGFLIGCRTASNDGDVSGNHGGTFDGWIVKLDSNGTLKWQKCLGGVGGDGIHSVCVTPDKGFFAIGNTNTVNNGDVAGCHSANYDAWVVKLDSAGVLQWQKCLGGGLTDGGYGVVSTRDGGCALGGFGRGGGDLTANQGSADTWIVKLYPAPTHVITGNVFEDLNGNCIKDAGEAGLKGRAVKAMPGNYFASTDANGNYTLFVDTGFYTISHIPNIYYSQICPTPATTYTAHINAATPNSYGNNFADTLIVHCADIKISSGAPYFRQCFKNTFNVSYSNVGSVTAHNVIVNVNFDNLIIPISSSIPWTIVGNNYVFNIDSIQAGQSGNFAIIDSVSCPTINGFHDACVFASIHTTTAECDTNNNCAHDCHYVVGSCDPNAKEVAISNTAFTTQENCIATDTLAYTIRFQNTGTFLASTIVIRDTLSANLNAASVESGASSFPYTFRIYGPSILEWTFNNINLPDSSANELASHGFVKFTVRQKPNNTQGTVIKNSANIIFDYNNPVLTDTTVVTIPQATTHIESNYIKTQTAIVYPNPTNNIVTVKSATELGLVTIYNIVGAVVYTQKINATELQIDLSKQAPGIYFLQTQNTYLKIIKE